MWPRGTKLTSMIKYSRGNCIPWNVTDVPHENINHLKEMLLRDEHFSIDHKDVVKLFAGLHVRKASGPDNISPLILKNCADQLAGVYKNLFEACVRTKPSTCIWKTATIIPVPKNAKAK